MNGLTKEQDDRLTAFEQFRDHYTGRIFDVTVLWFDRQLGEGMVRGNNGEGTWPIYACNIPGKKTWYPETACVYLNDGDIIQAELNVFYGGSILVSHTPGILDAEKWASLDQSRLAFKCNDNGELINGLFA